MAVPLLAGILTVLIITLLVTVIPITTIAIGGIDELGDESSKSIQSLGASATAGVDGISRDSLDGFSEIETSASDGLNSMGMQFYTDLTQEATMRTFEKITNLIGAVFSVAEKQAGMTYSMGRDVNKQQYQFKQTIWSQGVHGHGPARDPQTWQHDLQHMQFLKPWLDNMLSDTFLGYMGWYDMHGQVAWVRKGADGDFTQCQDPELGGCVDTCQRYREIESDLVIEYYVQKTNTTGPWSYPPTTWYAGATIFVWTRLKDKSMYLCTSYDSSYDPRWRGWFWKAVDAKANGRLLSTDLYLWVSDNMDAFDNMGTSVVTDYRVCKDDLFQEVSAAGTTCAALKQQLTCKGDITNYQGASMVTAGSCTQPGVLYASGHSDASPAGPAYDNGFGRNWRCEDGAPPTTVERLCPQTCGHCVNPWEPSYQTHCAVGRETTNVLKCGEFVGTQSTDVAVGGLSRIVHEAKVRVSGHAAVFEIRTGSRGGGKVQGDYLNLIGHPNGRMTLRPKDKADLSQGVSMVTLGCIRDPVVRELAKQMPYEEIKSITDRASQGANGHYYRTFQFDYVNISDPTDRDAYCGCGYDLVDPAQVDGKWTSSTKDADGNWISQAEPCWGDGSAAQIGDGTTTRFQVGYATLPADRPDWVIATITPLHEFTGERDRLVTLMTEKSGQLRTNMNAKKAQLATDITSVKASSDKNTDDLKSETRTAIIIVAVVVSIASVILGIGVALQIVYPVTRLKSDMADVAEMKVQHIQSSGRSIWADIASMQSSFETMVNNLIEYKSYMPANLFAEEVEFEDVKSVPPPIGSIGSPIVSARSGPQTRGSSGAGTRISQKQKMIADKVEKLKAVGVKKKQVSVMIVNCTGLNQLVLDQKSEQFAAFMAAYVDACVASIQSSRGVPDGFSGDHVYASYNAVTSSATHKMEVCNSSFLVKHKVDEAAKCDAVSASSSNFFSLPGVTFRCGVASGQAMVGTLGTATMKKFCIVGNVYNSASALQKMAKHHKVSTCVSFECYSEVKHSFFCKALDVVQCEKLAHKQFSNKFLFFELVKPKDVGSSEEWMYQLEKLEAAKGDPFHHYNEAMMVAARDGAKVRKDDVMKHVTAIPQEITAQCNVKMLESLAEGKFQDSILAQSVF